MMPSCFSISLIIYLRRPWQWGIASDNKEHLKQIVVNAGPVALNTTLWPREDDE